MRIGIYSGTFDPIHEGHMLFVQVAAEQFGLDKVLIMPEPQPRFKDGVSDIEHRRRMAELAAEQSDVEVEVVVLDDQPQHTINATIGYVADRFAEDEYFLMMGSDVFQHIGDWGIRDDEDGSVADISGAVGFIVAINGMSEHPKMKQVADEAGVNVQFVEPPLIALSSRNIRAKAKEQGTDQPIHGLNENVQRYIAFEKLYND